MIKRYVLALAVAVAGVLGVASVPAQAAASDCPVNTFCMWTGQNYTGSRWTYTREMFTNGTYNGIRLAGSAIDNHSNSWYNRMGSSWAINMFDSGTCASFPWTRKIVNGQAATSQGSDWGNRISSIQLASAAPLSC